MREYFLFIWIGTCVLGCEVSTQPTEPAAPGEYQLRDARHVEPSHDAGAPEEAPLIDLGVMDGGSDVSFQDQPDTAMTDVEGDRDRPMSGEPMEGNRDRPMPGEPMEGEPENRVEPGQCEECNDGFVCLASIDRCVPDCRLPENQCPARAPSCNEDDGTCIPSERRPNENQDPANEGPVDDAEGEGQQPCGGCDEGTVCAERLGRCVHDCRVDPDRCPDNRPQCDDRTGFCVPEAEGDQAANGMPNCDEGCGRAAVCDPVSQRCVRDCRSIIGRCPEDAPDCNPESGLCS